jgi:hypothetical protein
MRQLASARLARSRLSVGTNLGSELELGGETPPFPRGCRTNQTACTNLIRAVFADLVRAPQAGRAGRRRRKGLTPESSPCRKRTRSRDPRWFVRQPPERGTVRLGGCMLDFSEPRPPLRTELASAGQLDGASSCLRTDVSVSANDADDGRCCNRRRKAAARLDDPAGPVRCRDAPELAIAFTRRPLEVDDRYGQLCPLAAALSQSHACDRQLAGPVAGSPPTR